MPDDLGTVVEPTVEPQAAAPEPLEPEIVFGAPPEGPELPPELAGKSMQDVLLVLQQQNKDLEKRYADLQGAKDPTKTLLEGFEALKGALVQPRPQPQMASAIPQGGPPRDPEEVRKRRNEAIAADPAQGVTTLLQEEFGPALGAMIDAQQRLARQLLLVNPENKVLYDRYGAEIEDEIRLLPAAARLQNIDKLYESAAATIRGRHWQELIETEKAKWAGGGGAPPAAPPSPPKAPASYVDTSQRPPAAPPGSLSQRPRVYAPAGLKEWAHNVGVEDSKAFEMWQEGRTPFPVR